MNILYLHQYFVPPDGSGGTRSYEMARRLVREGHCVTLVTSSSDFPPDYNLTKWVTKLQIDGIDLIVLRVPYSNKYSFNRRIIAFLKFAIGALLESIKAKKIDLVFATSTPLTIAVPAIVAKIRHRCPMIFEVRDLWPEVPIAMGVLGNPIAIWAAKKLESLTYFMSSRVVTLSPGMAEGVKRTGVSPKKISVIPNSSDVDLFRVPEIEGLKFLTKYPQFKGGPLITYAGTLGAVNGVDYLVKIAEVMQTLNPKVRFLVVGEGNKKAETISLAERLNVLNKNIWFLPPMQKSEMPMVFSATTVATSFVIDLPELWNNSANKVFDAFAAGRPVMINHLGWQAEFLNENGAGLVIPPNDPILAGKILNSFLMDVEKIEKAKEAATKAADTVFNRDVLATSLRRLFEEVADEKSNKIPV